MKVTIGGVRYDIVYEDTRKAIAPNKPIGQIDYLKNKIQIYKHMTICRKRRSLMHEIVHGIIVGYHLKDLVHDDGRHNEAAVDLFMNRKINYTDIYKIIENELNGHKEVKSRDLDIIMSIDMEIKKKIYNLYNK